MEDKPSVPLNQPVFIQFLNPELLHCYGVYNKYTEDKILDHVEKMTRYAFLISGGNLIMPASYLFEVPFIEKYLDKVNPILKEGYLKIASSTSNLQEYAIEKKNEYRGDRGLFDSYREKSYRNKESPLKDDFVWIQRADRSASDDITEAWRGEIGNNGFWGHVISRYGTDSLSIHKTEAKIALIPDKLKGRAFIQRYVRPLLPFDLKTEDRQMMEILISKAYLESYLDEYNAFILRDTPLGPLDCEIQRYFGEQALTLSYRNIDNFLRSLGIREPINNTLDWWQIIQLTAEPIVGWAMRVVAYEEYQNTGKLKHSIIELNKPNQRTLQGISESEALKRIQKRLYDLYCCAPTSLTDLRSTEETDSITTSSRLIKDVHVLKKKKESTNMNEDANKGSNNVFLVKGRDKNVSRQFRNLLKSCGVLPVEWNSVARMTGGASPSTIDIVRTGMDKTQAVVVLFTPDEEVQLREELQENTDTGDAIEGMQPRPNVLVEAGMALALDRDKTLIVRVGTPRSISDLTGINYLDFSGSSPDREALRKRLETMGLQVDPDEDYHRVSFDGP